MESHFQNRRTLRPADTDPGSATHRSSGKALEGVAGLRAPRIVYVSCDAPTLARDVRALAAAGYELRQLTAFDLFPNTAHVETVAVLQL